MSKYDFKCTKCKKVSRDVELPMAQFSEARKLVKCCGEQMERHFWGRNLPGIRTDSSPNRGTGK